MMKKNNKNGEEVKNVHGEVSEKQTQTQKRTLELLDFLQEEPKSALIPFLRFSEKGVIPDVRLLLVKDLEDAKEQREQREQRGGIDKEDTDTTDAEEGENTDGASEEESGVDRPDSAQGSTG